MTNEARLRDYRPLRRLTVAALMVVGAIAVTWSWNSIVPDLSGMAHFRFAQGLSVAVTACFLGALFEAGRRFVATGAETGGIA